MKIICIITLLSILLAGCASEDLSKEDFEHDPILKNDPAELAIQHHRNKNSIKWMGYYGYTGDVPYAPDNLRFTEAGMAQIHWIIGTTDAVLGKEHEQYNRASEEFAKVYNKKRIELNRQSQPVK